VNDELSKSLEYIEETRTINIRLKTQLEEAKRIEELLKNQLDEKEESCQKMEVEVIDLRKKKEKFMNNSTILDEILDIQRSPNDKYGIGYNKEAKQFEGNTSKNHDVRPSFSKGESIITHQEPAQHKETISISE
jgi:hypothetical protein